MKPISTSNGDEEFEFTTGRKETANCHIIGIGPDLEVSDGYDGGGFDYSLTREEKIELADYMIALWQKFKEKIDQK